MSTLGKGLDVGTCFIVASSKNAAGEDVFRKIRDCYLSIPEPDESLIGMLSKAGANYIHSVDQDCLYVIGEDAIEFANITRRDLGRPMSSGVLNPQAPEVATFIMKEILKSVLGEPRVEKEVVVFSVPANPVDADFKNFYHSAMISRAIEQLGFTAKPMNEGLAVIHAENPTAKTDDGELPFTGVGISFGGGMVNVCFSYRGASLVEFSIADAYHQGEGSGGDWIDSQVAKTNASFTKGQVTKFKEKNSDFTLAPDELAEKISLENPKYLNRNREMCWALDVFFRQLISYALKHLSIEFMKIGRSIDHPIEIVVAGGTSMPPGFERLVKEEVDKLEFPFDIAGVRKGTNPFYSVASGCLVGAILAMEKKD